MKIRLPGTKKGRIAAGVGAFLGLVTIVGTISDASADPQDKQYEVCMKAYNDAPRCYEDVYNHRAPQGPSVGTPSAPQTTDPTVPPTSWNPRPAKHFHFNFDVPLDTTQVVDLR